MKKPKANRERFVSCLRDRRRRKKPEESEGQISIPEIRPKKRPGHAGFSRGKRNDY